MSRLKSWSFWLMVGVICIATVFTAVTPFLAIQIMSGAQWTAFVGGLYTVWSGKDAFIKRNGG